MVCSCFVNIYFLVAIFNGRSELKCRICLVNLSQHLKILKDAGILKSEKDGTMIYHEVKDDELKKLVDVTGLL